MIDLSPCPVCKNTELQISYNFNNVVIVKRRPVLANLLQSVLIK